MVILIGGASCTGKTLLAQRLLEIYQIPYVSIDHIKMGLIRGWPDCGFGATDGDDELTPRLWPIVKGIVMTNIENKQHIIIEGCYLPPEQLHAFPARYQDQIIACYIGFSPEYLTKHFVSGVIAHKSVIEHKDWGDDMDLATYQQQHQQLKRRCQNHQVQFFEIQDGYNAEMKAVFQWIDEQIEMMNADCGIENRPIT